MRSELTDTDYDALFAVMKADMPQMWRDIFPKILAQLEGAGVLTITVTDTEVVVSSTKPRGVSGGPETAPALTRKPALDQRIEQPERCWPSAYAISATGDRGAPRRRSHAKGIAAAAGRA